MRPVLVSLTVWGAGASGTYTGKHGTTKNTSINYTRVLWGREEESLMGEVRNILSEAGKSEPGLEHPVEMG